MSMHLYVGNLSPATTEEHLREHFSREGKVYEATVIRDKKTGQSRGFAFVEMLNEIVAAKARERLQGQLLDGRALVIKPARPRERGSGTVGNAIFWEGMHQRPY